MPGQVDLSVDVDFKLIEQSVMESAHFHYMSQKDFLTHMGIGTRTMVLLQACKTKDERKRLVQDYERLTRDMLAYQVSAVTLDEKAPYPFGLDLTKA